MLSCGLNACQSNHNSQLSIINVKLKALEFRHLYGIYGAFISLVAEASAATVFGLLQVVGGEQAVDYGYFALGVELGNAVCHALANVVEVRSFAADDATENYYCVISAVECHLVSTVNKLEAARNGLYVDVLRQRTVLFESLHRAVEQCARDFWIPLRHDYAEAHVACIGHFGGVVVRQVVQ